MRIKLPSFKEIALETYIFLNPRPKKHVEAKFHAFWVIFIETARNSIAKVISVPLLV